MIRPAEASQALPSFPSDSLHKTMQATSALHVKSRVERGVGMHENQLNTINHHDKHEVKCSVKILSRDYFCSGRAFVLSVSRQTPASALPRHLLLGHHRGRTVRHSLVGMRKLLGVSATESKQQKRVPAGRAIVAASYTTEFARCNDRKELRCIGWSSFYIFQYRRSRISIIAM